jgi:hypothetical protein
MAIRPQAKAETPAEQCVMNLSAIPYFLLKSDTGAGDDIARGGTSSLWRALGEHTPRAPEMTKCCEYSGG